MKTKTKKNKKMNMIKKLFTFKKTQAQNLVLTKLYMLEKHENSRLKTKIKDMK